MSTDRRCCKVRVVQAETSRVLSSGCTDVVRILALRKVYRTLGKPKYAVKDLSLGLPRGECFGFLGINGAGKTSTLNMLTGAILPSGGTAKLGGFDIVTEQWQVRRVFGGMGTARHADSTHPPHTKPDAPHARAPLTGRDSSQLRRRLFPLFRRFLRHDTAFNRLVSSQKRSTQSSDAALDGRFHKKKR